MQVRVQWRLEIIGAHLLSNKAYDTIGLLTRGLDAMYHLAQISLELEEFASVRQQPPNLQV